MNRVAVLVVSVGAVALLLGQPKAFDAVSIRPNRSGAPASDTNTSPGRLSLVNVTPLSVLLRAFGVQESQIVNSPDWAATDRYDIIAVTAGAERLTDIERQGYLQSMLAERWQLRYHRESRELPVLSLATIEKRHKLTPHPGPGVYSMKVAAAAGRQILTSVKGNIPRLIEILSRQTGRIVWDDTGLTGDFDFTLEWAPDSAPDASSPSLSTALREQLGLRLTSARRPVEVIVLDQIARPSEN